MAPPTSAARRTCCTCWTTWRKGSDPAAAAQAIAAAREAALADDAGKALDATLALHGAPPRPLKEQPIRFVRRPAQGKA